MSDSSTLDISHLRTFVAIDECGGFGRAAASLQMSQPTVSKHVRALERRLGQRLVERAGRGTAFTVAGERLLVESRKILRVHDGAVGRLEAPQSPAIVVGSTETAADSILPALMASIDAAFPAHRVQFRVDPTPQMDDAVDRGAVDIAVVLGLGDYLPGEEVGQLPLDWYASPAWEAPAEGDVLSLVTYVEPCPMRQHAVRLLAEAGHGVAVAVESTSVEGVIAAARAGLGVAVLPTAGPAPDGLQIRRDLPELGRISVRLLAREGLDRDIVDVARSCLSDFYKDGRRLHLVAG